MTKIVTDFNFQIKHHPPNPYFTNPDGSYPTNPHFNPHHPHPPSDTMYETPYHPWNLPKYEEYTTQCCKTLNVSTSDTSNFITRGNTKNQELMDKHRYFSKEYIFRGSGNLHI